MGIKSNLFLFKIKFILCEIACFLWCISREFLLFCCLPVARCSASIQCVCVTVFARTSHLLHSCPFVRREHTLFVHSVFAGWKSESFAIKVFIRAKAHQFHENIAAYKGKSARWVEARRYAAIDGSHIIV